MTEPVKRAQASHGFFRELSPASRVRELLRSPTWGLRPRLYALTCFAGLCSEMLGRNKNKVQSTKHKSWKFYLDFAVRLPINAS